MFRIIAAVLFLIGAVVVVLNHNAEEPFFWLLAGLSAYALAGSSFERKL